MSYTQTLNDALIIVAFMIGVAFALTVAMVTASALWQRHARRVGLGAVEQHLAAVTQQASPPTHGDPAAEPTGRRSTAAAAIAALARRREAGPLSGTAARVPAEYADTVYLVRHAVNVNVVNI